MRRRNFIKNSLHLVAGVAIMPKLLSCSSMTNETAFIDRILPAPINGGYQDPDYWVWGSSVIKEEDNRYHMFASRWNNKLNFGNWVTNSEVVHAVADTPIGPYKTLEVVLPVRGKGRHTFPHSNGSQPA